MWSFLLFPSLILSSGYYLCGVSCVLCVCVGLIHTSRTIYTVYTKNYLGIQFTNMHYMHVFYICTKHSVFMDAWYIALIIENAVRRVIAWYEWKMYDGLRKTDNGTSLFIIPWFEYFLWDFLNAALTIHIATLVTEQMPDVFTHCSFYPLCVYGLLSVYLPWPSLMKGKWHSNPLTHSLSSDIQALSNLVSTMMIISAIHCPAAFRNVNVVSVIYGIDV